MIDAATPEALSDHPKSQCDILAIMAERILEYNQEEPPPHSLFEFPVAKHRSLRNIIFQDILDLARWDCRVEELLESINVLESEMRIPHACTTLQHHGGWTIEINKKLLHLIHAFIGTFIVLSQDDKSRDLLSIYHNKVSSESWNDYHIWIALMHDIEGLFRPESFLELELSGFHYLHKPYTYCLSVISCRKFVVAHEIAHMILNHHEIYNPEEQEAQREHEYEADSLAIDILFNKYKDRHHDELTDAEVLEFDCMILGIFSSFLMMHHCERLLGWHGSHSKHPRSEYRLLSVAKQIYNNRISTPHARRYYRYVLSQCHDFRYAGEDAYNTFKNFGGASSQHEAEETGMRLNHFGILPDDLTTDEIKIHCQNKIRLIVYNEMRRGLDYEKIIFFLQQAHPSDVFDCIYQKLDREYPIPFNLSFNLPNREWTESVERSIDEAVEISCISEHVRDFMFYVNSNLELKIVFIANPSSNPSNISKFINIMALSCTNGTFPCMIYWPFLMNPILQESLYSEADSIKSMIFNKIRSAIALNTKIEIIYETMLDQNHHPEAEWK